MPTIKINSACLQAERETRVNNKADEMETCTKMKKILFLLLTSIDTVIGDIKIKAAPLRHADNHAGEIKNLGFVLNIGGLKIFHPGDIGAYSIDEYHKLNIQNDSIDIVFVPSQEPFPFVTHDKRNAYYIKA